MKTLIINGSPKRNGDTQALIDELIRHLPGEIREVSSVFDDIGPCVDCRYCWSNAGCAIDDAMQGVYPYLEECDNVVIASPIWFSELSGPTLNLASRLQTYFAARHFRGETTSIRHKSGVLILVGGEPGTEKKAISTAHTLFRLMNALPCVATVLSMNTDAVPAAVDGAALEAVRSAADLLKTNPHPQPPLP